MVSAFRIMKSLLIGSKSASQIADVFLLYVVQAL